MYGYTTSVYHNIPPWTSPCVSGAHACYKTHPTCPLLYQSHIAPPPLPSPDSQNMFFTTIFLPLLALVPASLQAPAEYPYGTIDAPLANTTVQPGANFSFSYNPHADYALSSFAIHVWLLTGTAVDDPWGQSEKTGHYFGRYDYANYPGAYCSSMTRVLDPDSCFQRCHMRRTRHPQSSRCPISPRLLEASRRVRRRATSLSSSSSLKSGVLDRWVPRSRLTAFVGF